MQVSVQFVSTGRKNSVSYNSVKVRRGRYGKILRQPKQSWTCFLLPWSSFFCSYFTVINVMSHFTNSLTYISPSGLGRNPAFKKYKSSKAYTTHVFYSYWFCLVLGFFVCLVGLFSFFFFTSEILIEFPDSENLGYPSQWVSLVLPSCGCMQ